MSSPAEDGLQGSVTRYCDHDGVSRTSYNMQGIMRRMSSQEAGALGRRLSSQEASGRLSMDSSILGGARYPRCPADPPASETAGCISRA